MRNPSMNFKAIPIREPGAFQRCIPIHKACGLFLVTILLISLQAYGQNELRMQAGMEHPLGELKWIYKPAQSMALEYARLNDLNKGTTQFGVGIKYFRFIPKEGIFYFLASESEYGTVVYSNYSFYQLYVTFRRNIPLSKKLDFFLGGIFGYYYVRYKSELHEPGATINESVFEGKGALAPMLGFHYKISEKFGLSYQSKYNLYFSIGQNHNPQETNFNPNIGSFNYFLTNDLGVFFRF